MENNKPVCPVCGTTMISNELDGSFFLDGSLDLSGYKCPACNQSLDSEQESNK